MHRDSSGIDSETSFEHQMALHALETAVLCLFPNPYTHLNLGVGDMTKILYHDMTNFISR